MYTKLHDYINHLNKTDECITIDFSAGDCTFADLPAILYYFDTINHKAVLIRNLPDSQMQILGNTYGSVQRLCSSIGIIPDQETIEKLGHKPDASPGGLGGCGGNQAYLLNKFQRASLILLREKLLASTKSFLPVSVLEKAPCSANFIPSPDADLTDFCLPIQYCENDSGAFLNSGVIVTRSPENGMVNYAIRRHQIHDRQTLGAFIAHNSHTMKHLKQAAKRGSTLEAAIVIGISPAVMMAASMYVPEHIGETSVAGNLSGLPLEVVTCNTIDLQVPACAEIVLEGYIDPKELKDEGPMTEYTDCCIGKSKKNVFHLTGIMHKSEPIYQTLRSGRSSEHELMLIVSNWSKTERLKNLLNKEFSDVVTEVAFGAGSSASHAIVQVKNIPKREGDKILEWILKSHIYKLATIVDESVSPFNQEEIAWATFVFAGSSKDFLKIDSSFTTPVDPTASFCPDTGQSKICKIGINAISPGGYTKPLPPSWNQAKKDQIERFILEGQI